MSNNMLRKSSSHSGHAEYMTALGVQTMLLYAFTLRALYNIQQTSSKGTYIIVPLTYSTLFM